ncbi:unnamed protein product [Diatraea saccharalis]|uniref:DUF7869 domain-containing protein n=1 Tax=Diatraea saccharalis TaxID=40085 RepID=A0A9N9N1N9_9NEOP|nr:unnamed protein product [Diatraea saccharalis]
MSSDNECENVRNDAKKRKKGVKNEENYVQNVRKRQRISGREYTTQKNKLVQAKTIGENCRCKKQCFNKTSEDQRQMNFDKLYSIESKNGQDIFLQSLISCTEIERRRPRVDDERSKSRFGSYTYYVEVNKKTLQVCKKAFMSIFAVSAKRIRRLSYLKQIGKVPKDGRGKEVTSRRAIDGNLCLKIREHIESFDVKSVHYGNSEKKYLSASLDIKQMHKMFLQKNPECNSITYSFYRKYFKENFSLSFGRPQVDTCSKCEELNAKIKSNFLCESAKRVAVGELLVHKTRAKKFYKKIEQVKNDIKNKQNAFAICIDYMQNLPLPHIPVQEIFYYRQLWVNEFCVHNLKTDAAVFYSYHEGIANKGPNEVCSFLLHYMEHFMPSAVDELHIFSDGCAGQNKNNTVVRFLMALTQTHRFQKIYHYFPTRGHSFLPCDRDFGLVKRKIKRYDRVYTPEEYENIIVASSYFSKISVFKVTTQMVIDFKTWWTRLYKKNCISIQSLGKKVPKDKKVNFNVSLFQQFYYDSSNPGVVQTREYIDGFLKFDFKLAIGRENVLLPTAQAYGDKVPINIKKIEDIKKVMKHISTEFSTFYNDIINWPAKSSETLEEDVE